MKFKYNFCFSSTKYEGTYKGFQNAFKYNFCFSSTNKIFDSLTQNVKFKYNFCFSSTSLEIVIVRSDNNLNTTFVSLQRIRRK